jgi:hypothetical protein
LIERGFEAVGFEQLAQAVAAIQDPNTAKPLLIVLELRNQPLRKIEMDQLMRFEIPVVTLAGLPELQEPLLQQYSWAAILRRPISIGAICNQIKALLQ